jgi:hypothetical protein
METYQHRDFYESIGKLMTAIVDLVRFSLSKRNPQSRRRILAASLVLSAAGLIAACSSSSLVV